MLKINFMQRAICSFDTLKSINATTPGAAAAVKLRLNHTNRHQIQFEMEI